MRRVALAGDVDGVEREATSISFLREGWAISRGRR
jgi:hypothetical protein